MCVNKIICVIKSKFMLLRIHCYVASRLANALPFAQLEFLFLQGHNLFALGPMSILRTVPVSLLKVPTAVIMPSFTLSICM